MKFFKLARNISIPFILSSIFGCSDYTRENGCDLDAMHIKGNVVRIETITQSTMPLTELFAKAFDPSFVVSSYDGNFCLDIDNHGNIKRNRGYDIEGANLFDVDFQHPHDDFCTVPCVILKPNKHQPIDEIKTVKEENGNVTNVKYYNGEELIWEQNSVYNNDGTIRSIIKEYTSYKIEFNHLSITYSDTTLYNYISYDDKGNWTELEAEYRGVFPKHNYNYKVKRQITYYGEAEKQPLIERLKEYNNPPIAPKCRFTKIEIGKWGYMSIPYYMAQVSNEMTKCVQQTVSENAGNLNYLYNSLYDNNVAYASFSISKIPCSESQRYDHLDKEDLEYNIYVDVMYQKQMEEGLAQNNILLLKWLPYEFVEISGRRALHFRYYRYGIGSPIPVYCDTYTIPVSDGFALGIIFSFQCNLYERFYDHFNKAINSIVFY